jgi:hypothetical protein
VCSQLLLELLMLLNECLLIDDPPSFLAGLVLRKQLVELA